MKPNSHAVHANLAAGYTLAARVERITVVDVEQRYALRLNRIVSDVDHMVAVTALFFRTTPP